MHMQDGVALIAGRKKLCGGGFKHVVAGEGGWRAQE